MKKPAHDRGLCLTPKHVKQLSRQIGRSAAVFVKQLNFWILSPKDYGVVHEGKTWIFNSLEAWGDQLCLSRATLARVVSKLTKLGVIEVKKLSKCKSRQTNYYTLNHQALQQFLGEEKILSQQTKKTPETQVEETAHPFLELRPSPSQDETIYISNNLHNSTLSLGGIEQKGRRMEAKLVRQLLTLWNDATGQECQLTLKREAYLKAAFYRCF